MKISFVFFLLVLFSLALQSQENTLLWEITGNGMKKPSYLYGTLHSRDYRAHQFGDSVMPALARVDAVVLEIIDKGGMADKEIMNYAFMKDQTLEKLLDKKDYDFVKTNAATKLGSAALFFNTMKPLFTMIIGNELVARKEMELTVDEFIETTAQKKGKKKFALETTEEAMAALDAIPLEEQSKFLLEFFRDYDKNNVLSDSIIRLYQHQNMVAMYKIYDDVKSASMAFEKNLVEKRNRLFAERLIVLLKKQSLFCAVGTLHLPGETGLISALRQQGYKVRPVYNHFTPKAFVVQDKRKWLDYGNDSLMVYFKCPADPFFESAYDSTSQSSSVIYYLKDSLYGLLYSVSCMAVEDTALMSHPADLYKETADRLGQTKNWIETGRKNMIYQERAAMEVEYNVASGQNTRGKIISNGRRLYLLTVTGSKEVIYSNVAEHFFSEATFLNPLLFLKFNLTDEITLQPLESFETRIQSSQMDTIIRADSIGYISLSLPGIEDDYTITFISKGYVSKKALISTIGLNYTGKSELLLNGNVSLIKPKQGKNYAIFETPVARAKVMNKAAIAWDFDYIKTMKEKIANQK